VEAYNEAAKMTETGDAIDINHVTMSKLMLVLWNFKNKRNYTELRTEQQNIINPLKPLYTCLSDRKERFICT
jgi:hypothetical protein